VSPPGSPPLQPRLKRQDETSFHGKPLGNSGGHESSRTARRRKVPVFPDGCGTAVYRCVSECAITCEMPAGTMLRPPFMAGTRRREAVASPYHESMTMSQDGRRGGAHIYRPQRPSNRPPCCTGPPATQCYYDVVRQLFGRAQRLGRRERARGRPALGAGCLAWPRGWWVRRGGVAGRGACARGVRRMLLLRCPLALRGASHPDPCRPRLPPLPAPCIRRQGRGRTAGRWRWSPAHRPRHPARTGPPAAVVACLARRPPDHLLAAKAPTTTLASKAFQLKNCDARFDCWLSGHRRKFSSLR
jgi:hypothetical protein